MKKLLSLILCAAAAFCTVFGFTACGGGEGITVCAPDGAPALSIAYLLHENPDFGESVNYSVVDANEVNSRVTYKDDNKNADLCILPVNDAVALLGSGARYKLLGTVTHGNLYILSASGKPALTRENFATEILGKKIGVVQLPRFPGIAFKTVLKDYGVLNSVTLQGVQPAEVTGISSDCDYFVIPEPAASTRLNNKNLNLSLAGSVQKLYGGAVETTEGEETAPADAETAAARAGNATENAGYPQAVLVAKNSLIEKKPEFVEKFVNAMTDGAAWLLNVEVTAEMILNAVKKGYADPDNTAPAFNAKSLTKEVIKNCFIKFSPASECKEQIKTFITKIKGVAPDFSGAADDDFFYRLIEQ